MHERAYTFIGGETGRWRIETIRPVSGEALSSARRLDIRNEYTASLPPAAWMLRGVVSNERYVTRSEREALVARSPALGRPEATAAAMIPIKKSPAWWALAQDERRAIVEEQSQHMRTGLLYLPAVARRLHHCRDLGEPFDFITWFEYAPGDAAAFEDLVAKLRGTLEWKYVEREVDVRLVLD